ncbi:MAG: hypothetical protein ACLQNE_20345 [Thermoguttaceae bacterium]
MSSWRKKESVFIVAVPEGFRPQRPWDVPEELRCARLFTKNVNLESAASFCRIYNKRQMEKGSPIRQWAIVIKHVRALWRPSGQGGGHAL